MFLGAHLPSRPTECQYPRSSCTPEPAEHGAVKLTRRYKLERSWYKIIQKDTITNKTMTWLYSRTVNKVVQYQQTLSGSFPLFIYLGPTNFDCQFVCHALAALAHGLSHGTPLPRAVAMWCFSEPLPPWKTKKSGCQAWGLQRKNSWQNKLWQIGEG